jgi:hypothetical protein
MKPVPIPFRRQFIALLANHADTNIRGAFLLANDFAPSEDGWIQLVPYGDYPHSGPLGGDGKPLKKNGKVLYPVGVVQRLDNEAAKVLVDQFNSVAAKLARAFVGLPWYIGHPDLDPVKYPDSKSYGWIKDLANRDDGLYAKVDWNPGGKELIEGKSFKLFSPFFSRGEDTGEKLPNGRNVIRPTLLKSVGFTNNPNIDVIPLANAADGDDFSSTGEEAAAEFLVANAIERGVLNESDRAEWISHFEEDFVSAQFVLANVGNSEGAKKGWITRRAAMASKPGPSKVAAKVAAKTARQKAAPKKAAAGKAKVSTAARIAARAKTPPLPPKTAASPPPLPTRAAPPPLPSTPRVPLAARVASWMGRKNS